MTRTRRVVKIIGPWRVSVSLVCGVVATVSVAFWFQLFGSRYDFPEWSYDDESVEGRLVIQRSLAGWIFSELSPGMKDGTVRLFREERARNQNLLVPTPDQATQPPGVFRLPVRRMAQVLADEQPDAGARSGFRGSAEAYGFPFLCARRWVYPEPSWVPAQNDDLVFGGSVRITGPLFGVSNIDLAVSPYWPGLVGNVVAWGLSLYCVVSLPAVTTGVHRRLSNRCHSCGYRLEGLTTGTCPECGWAIKRMAALSRGDGNT